MFSTSFFLRNRHIQTLYAPLLRKQNKPQIESEIFELEDGDFVECYWHDTKPIDERPIVVLLHGLTGSFNSPYIQGMMHALKAEGFASVLMHFRGCSGKENRLPRGYHSGDTTDVKAWIDHLHHIYPNNDLYAVGYSIGGNVLLKLLGEEREKTLLSAAVSVSAPMLLDVCTQIISKGFSKLYERHLLSSLRASLLKKYTLFDMETRLKYKKEDIHKIQTIEAFDEVYTAPIHGFSSAREYYNLCSSKQFLKHIHIPTHIIHAEDDPFMDERVIPKEEELSSSVTLEVSPYGGHVGFISGSLFKPKYWLEERVVQYFLENQRGV
ncbi:MAG: Hydrolase, alpha/beta fold family functionally coupled to Phosphoribulokinase [uncultured Sulfurovum sp.]|uniref:Hydrolase, alpha/beta fold family functionally coupled to Phosphoribulokinase n=1 Tax=uncultured Sulfurovum sp. TaxID=269237 RepID=A0A6S6S9G6_9BACT|nr:MAG: Hydrolase, alpha/beta fold family functionally coupled to Phosphoribulokinase [uncultured Sulfurovum sp.]